MAARRRAGVVIATLALLACAGFGYAQEQAERDAVEPQPPAATPPLPDAPDARSDAPVAAEAAAAAPEESAPPVNETAPAPQAAAPPPPPPEPLKRPRLDAAVLQAVDKVTAETLRFEARVGEPVRYKGLVLTVRACEQTAADEEMRDSVANLDVVFQPASIPGRATIASRTIFHGWMFASSPSLHPLAQPSYDVWLIACKAASAPRASA